MPGSTSFLWIGNMGICVIEETQLCVHTLARARACVGVRARWLAHSPTRPRALTHTHTHILSPAGVLISPRGRVSVDPKTL